MEESKRRVGNMKNCPRCAAQLEDDDNVCNYCGYVIDKSLEVKPEIGFYCSNCGNKVGVDDLFCNKCGNKIEKDIPKKEIPMQMDIPQYDRPVKEDKTTAILAIVFALLFPIVGFIFGIMGLRKYKTQNYRVMSMIGIVLAILSVVFNFIYIMKFGNPLTNE